MGKKSPKINKVPLEEVERLYHYCKSASQVANLIDVKEPTLYQFKWKNKKEFSRLSAMREQGLLLDESTEPKLMITEEGPVEERPLVINPVPEKDEDYIAKLELELEESNKIVESQKVVIERMMNKERTGRPKPTEKEIKLQEKVDELKKQNDFLRSRNKEVERIAENKPKLEEQLLNKQLKDSERKIQGMQVTIETSAKKVENQRNEIEKLTSAIKESESKQRLMVNSYETKLAAHQDTINKAGETNKILRAELEKQEAQNIDLVAENAEVKRQLELKDEMYQNAMDEIKRLDNKLYALSNSNKEYQHQIKGYQDEIVNMTTNAVPVTGDVSQLSMELAFYKEHAIQYYNQIKGAN